MLLVGAPRVPAHGGLAGGIVLVPALALILNVRPGWLDEAERPFFLWSHFYDPHYPFDPPRPWPAGARPSSPGS